MQRVVVVYCTLSGDLAWFVPFNDNDMASMKAQLRAFGTPVVAVLRFKD